MARWQWWDTYGAFSPSADVQGYPDVREVFLAYYQRSGMSRAELANGLGVGEKMIYHLEKYGRSLTSIRRLRRLCQLLNIPAVLFGLAEPPKEPQDWRRQGYDWPEEDGFPAPGAVLRYFRQQKGWHQRDLAEALGVSEVVVRQMEKKNQKLDTISRRRAITFVLGISSASVGFLGLDALHVPAQGVLVRSSARPPIQLTLEETQAIQQQLWAGFYASQQGSGLLQAGRLYNQIREMLPMIGQAEQPPWLEAQSLLLQWAVAATRESGDPNVFGRAKKALELAKQAQNPDLITVARMRQMETSYLLGKEGQALGQARVLAQAQARDPVVDATRAVAAARVLALAATDQEDRSQVLTLLDQSEVFGGAYYGLYYDLPSYRLRRAETLMNLAQNAPDGTRLLREAGQWLEHMPGPLSPLRQLGVWVAQAKIAAGLHEYETAAVCANEAISLGLEIGATTHLPWILEVYQRLQQSPSCASPQVAKLGLSLLHLRLL